jgi:DhnA family fructose-bisphosphate aldolase class Ia
LGHKAFIVPVDDLLIFGAAGQLTQYKETIPLLKNPAIDAILGFPGVFNQFYNDLHKKPWIINLTTSTILSSHTHKRLSLTLQNAISSGCDTVAVHVNLSSPNEGKMIQSLAHVSCECQAYGIPLMAIMYPRKPYENGEDDNYLQLKTKDNTAYTRIVSHACRIAVELGADIIKTNYTGLPESFREVVYSSGSTPVVIAGGERVDEEAALDNIRGAIAAGAAGICFGRNLFYRNNIPEFIRKVRAILDENE